MIIWLASYPRSGNTYARQILATCGGVKTYSIYGDRVLSRGKIAEAIGHTALPDPLDVAINSNELYFVKTHSSPDVGPQIAEYPAIYIIRDGRDAIVSHVHYLATKRNPYETMLRELVRGRNKARRSWSSHVMAWKDRMAPTAYVRYEDMLINPVGVMQGALDRLYLYKLRLTRNKWMMSFSELHSINPRFFRKGKAGSWKEEMPNDIHRLFWEVHGEGMKAYGYEGGSHESQTTAETYIIDSQGPVESVVRKEVYNEKARVVTRITRHIRRGSKRRKGH